MRFVLVPMLFLLVLASPLSAALPALAEGDKPPTAAAGEAAPEAKGPEKGPETGTAKATAKGADAEKPAMPLGTTEKALRERFGAALHEEPIEQKVHPGYAFMKEKMRARQLPGEGPGEGDVEDPDPLVVQDPFEGQSRLVRKIPDGDIIEVEYDLYQGKVYAVRWKLAERFERTIMESYVAAASERYGKPEYDQMVPAKFGSGKVDVRRTAWSRGDRLLEVRQLDPKSGGPVYVMLSDRKAHKAIVAARGVIAPSPETMGPWWERPAKQYQPIAKKEREALLKSFNAVLDKTGF